MTAKDTEAELALILDHAEERGSADKSTFANLDSRWMHRPGLTTDLLAWRDRCVAEAEKRAQKMWKREHDYWKNLAEQLMQRDQLSVGPRKLVIEIPGKPINCVEQLAPTEPKHE